MEYNRYRQRGSLVSVANDCEQLVADENCAASSTDHHYSYFSSGLLRGSTAIMRDNVTPNFAKRRAAGEIIFNRMASSQFDVVGNPGVYVAQAIPPHSAPSCPSPVKYVRWTAKGYDFTFGFISNYGNTGLYTFPRVPDGLENSIVDEAWTACLARRKQGGSNYFESLAEADQAFGLLHSPLQNVVQFTREFRDALRKKKKLWRLAYTAKALRKLMASEWLKFRYGIKPLMSDVAAAMKALETGYNRKPMRYTARAQRNFTATEQSSGSFNYDVASVQYRQDRRADYYVKAMFIDEYIRTIWQDLGFTPANLLGLPWELLRLSFVIDWFVNVGDVIYANMPRVNVLPRGGMVTVKRQGTIYTYPYSSSPLDPLKYTVSGPTDSVRVLNTQKDRYQRLDSGALVINTKFGLDGWVRCTDAAALINQHLVDIASLFSGSRIRGI